MDGRTNFVIYTFLLFCKSKNKSLLMDTQATYQIYSFFVVIGGAARLASFLTNIFKTNIQHFKSILYEYVRYEEFLAKIKTT